MARVWIEDRADHTEYVQAVARAKKAGRTPPGRWRVRWYGPDGKPKAKTFALKVKGEDYRSQVEARLGDGTYRDPAAGRVTFATVADSWFKSQLHLKRSSRARYRIALDTHVIPRWGSTPVDRIQYDDIAAWLTELATGKTTNGRPQAARSIRKTYVVLSRVLGFAVKSRRLAFNPAAGVPLPAISPADHVYLDEVQVEALADAAAEYRAFILLLAYTGLRWGEASALKVGRIDLTARRAHIVEAFGLDGGKLYLDTPKNHERRSVPLSAFLIDELEPHLEGRSPDDLLFTGPQSGALRASNFVRRVFDPAVIRAGLGDLGVTPHKLRHTAASLAIASGADVNVVQTMLGHKSASMTLDVYGHLFPDRLDEVSKKMHKRRARVLAKAKAKAEKAARKAQEAAAELVALEQASA
ncbi:Site-specific recombinase XerD [Streptomyces sp. DvalAA-14]|uniref:tyrosine-type recombinase/integrase n=1 Tax=unclassified Streptomyces TaxID=2593676 RepID=UPI00081B76EF|nr:MULTISPECIES: site-specific integrase [unclassified Streptomyces]MYS25175.1 tyrosine-type recombinase/integrase [Streptomyces sp. SID4948]SCE52698.1 Site-specific recombinase XerD [Streptomyces sp. DvalAA-14]